MGRCNAMPCHATPRRAVPRCATPRHPAPHHTTSLARRAAPVTVPVAFSHSSKRETPHHAGRIALPQRNSRGDFMRTRGRRGTKGKVRMGCGSCRERAALEVARPHPCRQHPICLFADAAVGAPWRSRAAARTKEAGGRTTTPANTNTTGTTRGVVYWSASLRHLVPRVAGQGKRSTISYHFVTICQR